MNENESILYIKIKLGKRSICVKYAIRFLSVAAFFLMIEQTSFFITRHAAKNMLAEKEQKEILIRLPPKSESEVRVNAQMDIFLEEYSVDTGQLLFVEPYWDIRLAGMNEEELRIFLSDPSHMEEKDDIQGCIRCELIEMDWCTLRIRKYVTSQNTFVHGKENFNENTGACHWSGCVRIDGCDICRPQRMQGAYS